jgi:CubicO group peptidase (beta-lactamase class C family)
MNDVWHIGSNLKAITAALGAIAVDRGVIEWTSTVEGAFPEFAAGMRDEYRTVTLRDLLSNGGRMRNDPPGTAFLGATARWGSAWPTFWSA